MSRTIGGSSDYMRIHHDTMAVILWFRAWFGAGAARHCFSVTECGVVRKGGAKIDVDRASLDSRMVFKQPKIKYDGYCEHYSGRCPKSVALLIDVKMRSSSATTCSTQLHVKRPTRRTVLKVPA